MLAHHASKLMVPLGQQSPFLSIVASDELAVGYVCFHHALRTSCSREQLASIPALQSWNLYLLMWMDLSC